MSEMKKREPGVGYIVARIITKIIILLVCISLLWMAGTYALHSVNKQSARNFKVPAKPRAINVTPRLGNVNGVPFSIPSNYLFFPVEYTDKSVWEPRKGKSDYASKTKKDAISNFTVDVQWPSLKPHLPENDESYKSHRSKRGPKEWISISVRAQDLDAPYYKTPQVDNGVARVLRSLLQAKKVYSRPDGVAYEFRNEDPVTGLNYAVPVGPGTERFDLWNKKLYWEGDPSGIVTTSIRCPNGKFPNPKSVGHCVQSFEILRIKAGINIYYTPDLLSQWSELQSKSRDLIFGLMTDQSIK